MNGLKNIRKILIFLSCIWCAEKKTISTPPLQQIDGNSTFAQYEQAQERTIQKFEVIEKRYLDIFKTLGLEVIPSLHPKCLAVGVYDSDLPIHLLEQQSEMALKNCENSLEHEYQMRRLFLYVLEDLKNTHISSIIWPFELLQQCSTLNFDCPVIAYTNWMTAIEQLLLLKHDEVKQIFKSLIPKIEPYMNEYKEHDFNFLSKLLGHAYFQLIPTNDTPSPPLSLSKWFSIKFQEKWPIQTIQHIPVPLGYILNNLPSIDISDYSVLMSKALSFEKDLEMLKPEAESIINLLNSFSHRLRTLTGDEHQLPLPIQAEKAVLEFLQEPGESGWTHFYEKLIHEDNPQVVSAMIQKVSDFCSENLTKQNLIEVAKVCNHPQHLNINSLESHIREMSLQWFLTHDDEDLNIHQILFLKEINRSVIPFLSELVHEKDHPKWPKILESLDQIREFLDLLEHDLKKEFRIDQIKNILPEACHTLFTPEIHFNLEKLIVIKDLFEKTLLEYQQTQKMEHWQNMIQPQSPSIHLQPTPQNSIEAPSASPTEEMSLIQTFLGSLEKAIVDEEKHQSFHPDDQTKNLICSHISRQIHLLEFKKFLKNISVFWALGDIKRQISHLFQVELKQNFDSKLKNIQNFLDVCLLAFSLFEKGTGSPSQNFFQKMMLYTEYLKTSVHKIWYQIENRLSFLNQNPLTAPTEEYLERYFRFTSRYPRLFHWCKCEIMKKNALIP